MNKAHLKAVHDDDLEGLLISLGVYESIVQGSRKCFFCDNTIKMNDIGSILPLDGTIQLSCNKEECLQKMVELGVKQNDD